MRVTVSLRVWKVKMRFEILTPNGEGNLPNFSPFACKYNHFISTMEENDEKKSLLRVAPMCLTYIGQG